MAYNYKGGGYSYEIPQPTAVKNEIVEELIKNLTDIIDGKVLKAFKPVLAKLKLAINDNYPTFTQETVLFTAYLYAKKNGNNNIAGNILTTILSKKWTFDGIPLFNMVTNFSKQDMVIVINDFFNVSSSIWHLEGLQTIEKMFTIFPKETEQFILNDRLNKFEKGENRLLTAVLICELSTNKDVIIKALDTFFNSAYALKYGMQQNKLQLIHTTLSKKTKQDKKFILNTFFYKTYLHDIDYNLLEFDYMDDIITEETLTNFVMVKFKKSNIAFLHSMSNIKNIEFRIKLITCNDEILNFVATEDASLLPDTVKDIFLF